MQQSSGEISKARLYLWRQPENQTKPKKKKLLKKIIHSSVGFSFSCRSQEINKNQSQKRRNWCCLLNHKKENWLQTCRAATRRRLVWQISLRRLYRRAMMCKLHSMMWCQAGYSLEKLLFCLKEKCKRVGRWLVTARAAIVQWELSKRFNWTSNGWINNYKTREFELLRTAKKHKTVNSNRYQNRLLRKSFGWTIKLKIVNSNN